MLLPHYCFLCPSSTLISLFYLYFQWNLQMFIYFQTFFIIFIFFLFIIIIILILFIIWHFFIFFIFIQKSKTSGDIFWTCISYHTFSEAYLFFFSFLFLTLIIKKLFASYTILLATCLASTKPFGIAIQLEAECFKLGHTKACIE